MKKITILFFILLINSGCRSDNTIKLIFNEQSGKKYNLIVNENIEDITIAPYKKNIISITNIEKLTKLKRLQISLIRSLENLSFLKTFKMLEILQISGQVKDIKFLEYFKKLKYMSIYGTLHKKELDLINNQKLEYLKLRGTNIEGQNDQFNLELKNIPKSLKYLNLQIMFTKKFSLEFLETIKDIPCVLIDKELYDQYKDFFSKHPNFTYEEAEKVLPPELIDDNLFYKQSEYEFF